MITDWNQACLAKKAIRCFQEGSGESWVAGSTYKSLVGTMSRE